MKFGLVLPSYGIAASKQSIIEAARLAEELDYDSLWSTDHVLVPKQFEKTFGHIYEPLTVLSYAAALTKDVKLGISILVLPMRNPIVVAKQVATIDALSGGRVILGLGAGWLEKEFSFLNVEFDERGSYLNEAIKVLRILWTDPNPSFKGNYINFSDAVFEPKPTQKSGPPIWIGGNSQAAIRRAAKLGDAWHPVGLTPEQLESGKNKIQRLAGGRRVSSTIRMTIDLGRKVRLTYKSAGGERRNIIGGTPTQAANTIETFQKSGVEHMVCYFGDKTKDIIFRAARLFAKEVKPSFES